MELARGPKDSPVDIVEEMAELLPERKPQRGRSSRETLVSFLEELMSRLAEILRAGEASPESLERWSAAARDAHARVESYNMPAGRRCGGPFLPPPGRRDGMRKFIQRALDKLGKMDPDQVRSLIVRVSEENDLLGMILESLTEGIIVTDREHRVMLFNKSAERLCPFATDDIVDKLLWDCLADRELADFFSSTLRSQGKAADREFTIDGSPPRLLSVSLLPLVRGGSVEGSVVHIEDVTEKRSKEARLRRAESLASLTTLAAGVAHEIKNPLGSMGIHLQLIQKKIAGKDCIEAKDIDQHLGVINEEVDRLNRIVVDFLFAVKPMDTVLEDGDVNHVIEELLQFVQPELDQSGVAVDARLSPALPLLRIDARYIKQALLNLIKNALAAMPGGGVLRIESLRSGDEVLVRIADTGMGIPDEIMDKIFEPYFTTKPFGTGLGLTIVFKIVKEHFGDISVTSRVGEGTTVTLALPGSAEGEDPHRLQGGLPVKFTILVADDEKNIREGLREALALDGYEVATAADGQEALETVNRGDVDLLITDLKMPRLSGEELLKSVTAQLPTMPVIILTGHGTIESAVQAMHDGAYDFLTKPVNLDRLSLLVKRALASREMAVQNRAMQEELERRSGFASIIGRSAEMKHVFEMVRQVAPSRSSVLITGESGSGKEMIAEALHYNSPRKDKPFIKLHCAALTESLLESELFGHEKGAFTGAIARKRGRFELAHLGTLFLDEIGEINQNVQIKLLRVLEEKRFERVGGEETVEVDVRLIAATNRDLKRRSRRGRSGKTCTTA